MKLEVPKGKYILAVSGGVDSMVLLHLLVQQMKHKARNMKHEKKIPVSQFPIPNSSAQVPRLELVVAHFNHNIRKDSAKDEKLVKAAASRYKLPFELGSAQLGPNASEQVARDARYLFLRQVQAKYKAEAVITAHHQDDVIETAFINVIRGTDRLGLSAIVNNKEVIRPLQKIPKAELLKYAKTNNLVWREDSTNQDTDYLRNYLRLNVLTKLTPVQKRKLISNLEKVAKINTQIDIKIATLSQTIDKSDIDRNSFAALPKELGNELIAHYLREGKVTDFDSNTIERLSMAIKTARPNSIHPVKHSSTLKIGKTSAKLITP